MLLKGPSSMAWVQYGYGYSTVSPLRFASSDPRTVFAWDDFRLHCQTSIPGPTEYSSTPSPQTLLN